MASAPNNTKSTLASFIWNNANDLWGDFPHTEFGKIILPFTVLRRLECVLGPTKDAVLNTYAQFKDEAIKLITERGYSVTDVAERLGVSEHNIYKWLKVVQPLRNTP